MTAEDPVEFNLNGINQVQMREQIGLTFAAALRSFLRQDPDVVMVGEIRDGETAEIGIKAALTGHLVFSTLHTNDAASAFTRLLDMGLEPFLVASTVIGILAQRLVRRVCPRCKELYEPESDLLRKLGLKPGLKLYRGKGCNACNKTGYKGRTGIYEFLVPDREVQGMILARSSADEIKDYCSKQRGFDTLRRDGLRKCVDGTTSLEQVLGATQE